MSVLLLLLLILLLLLLFPRFSCFKSLYRFTDSLFWIFKNWINFDCCIGMFLSSFVVVSHVNVRFHLIRFTVGFNISFLKKIIVRFNLINLGLIFRSILVRILDALPAILPASLALPPLFSLPFSLSNLPSFSRSLSLFFYPSLLFHISLSLSLSWWFSIGCMSACKQEKRRNMYLTCNCFPPPPFPRRIRRLKRALNPPPPPLPSRRWSPLKKSPLLLLKKLPLKKLLKSLKQPIPFR